MIPKHIYFQAYELSTLTGTQVMLLVASETGHVYTFATRKLQPMITSDAGKALIQVTIWYFGRERDSRLLILTTIFATNNVFFLFHDF